MSDDPAELRPTALRQRADACREVAAFSDRPDRKAIWLTRAKYWEKLALKAASGQVLKEPRHAGGAKD
jgi:hypothetical protein